MIHGYYLLHLWIVFLLCENKHLILSYLILVDGRRNYDFCNLHTEISHIASMRKGKIGNTKEVTNDDIYIGLQPWRLFKCQHSVLFG